MLFNSFVFPIFFLIVWAVYLCLKRKPQNLLLLAASYVFYGWWDYRFLVLLFISTITDYVIAQCMGKCGEKRQGTKTALLWTSISINLGILGFFKYFNFFADSFERVAAPLGLHPDFVTLNILLPVGISFYTFQTMAYTIDVYRGKDKVCKNFWDFALYVAFFPSLVAGPIDRSTNLIPQFKKPRSIYAATIYSACQLILMGYFKKVFIADGVAPIVAQCFDTPDKFGGITLILGSYLFALQIYGDFSGYTDIARGVSRLFGIELMLNFRQPYFSANVTDFWRRWHISLSSWLRDYLYIPLGGNRKGKFRTYTNNMITMLLGGLWHGAATHFIVWGLLHGIYLAVHKAFTGKKVNTKEAQFAFSLKNVSLHIINVFITFNLICFAWIFFRADSCSVAVHYLHKIICGGHTGIGVVGLYVAFYGLCMLLIDGLCAWQKSEVPFGKKIWLPVRSFGYAVMLFLIIFIGENDVQPFIYFQF